jgi:hypothetical protein
MEVKGRWCWKPGMWREVMENERTEYRGYKLDVSRKKWE